MNVMTRIMNSLPAYWEVFKAFLLPTVHEESEEDAADEPPPSKRRCVESDHFLMVPTKSEPKEVRHKIHHIFEETAQDDYYRHRDIPTTYPFKLKRKLQLESSVPNTCGTPFSATEKEEKENIIVTSECIDSVGSCDNDVLKKSSPQGESTNPKPNLKVIDLTTPESQSTTGERATWLDARTTCRLYASSDTRPGKENETQQLKVVAPSYSEKRSFPSRVPFEFRAKMFNSAAKLPLKPEMNGGGTSSLKRPNSSSLSSLCSTRSSLTGRKLQLLDESIRLDEREKYSALLQSYTRVPVMKHAVPQTRRCRSPPLSFLSHARKKYGDAVEVIDLTSQPEGKNDSRKTDAASENLGKAAGLEEPTPSSTLQKKLNKCNVYDVSWMEELAKMYNRKDRENRKRVLEMNVKAALCTQKSDQLLHEILEERVRTHLRLTEVAVEEGPVPVAEDEIPLPELTPEMEKRVSYAFKSGPGGEVLAEAFSLRITRRDMHTLVGTNWLNDEVINFYMNLLIERGKLDNYPNVYCFNTFFYPKLESQGHSSLKRWTRRVDVFSNELLIVPVHLGVHWCLACINFKEKKILYFDSMGGRNNTCLQILMRYLQDESLDKKRVRFDSMGWSLENVKDNPQQMNGSDCGMFSCMYAEYLCRRARINFSQSDMPYFRRKMAYEIVSKKLML